MAMTKTQVLTVLSLAGLSTPPNNWSPLNKEILYFVTDNDDNPISVNPRENRFRFIGDIMDVVKIREVKETPKHAYYDIFDDKIYEYHYVNGELQYDSYLLEDIYFIALNIRGEIL